MGGITGGARLNLKRAWMLHALAMAGCLAAPAASGAEQDAPPDDAFLEFLGSFETADGDWVDPLTLAGLDRNEEQRAESETDETGIGGEDEDET